jgi:hypothetical protein
VTDFESNALIVLLIAGLIPIVAFIYFYLRYSPWWETAIGRTLLGQKVAMAALLFLSLLLRLLGPDYALRAVLNGLVLAVLVVFFWKTLAELRRVQKAAPHRDALKAFIRRHINRKRE